MKMLILTLLTTFAFGALMTVLAQDKTEKVSIQVGEQKAVTKDKIKIKFVSVVEDSRCPEGVDCIWAGNAKIKVEISCNKRTETFEINTNLGPKGATFDGYAINMVNLMPTLKEGVETKESDYSATFEVSRLTR